MAERKKKRRASLRSALIYLLNLTVLLVIIIPCLPLKITSWWLDNLLSLQLQWALLAIMLLIISIKTAQKGLVFFSLLSFSAVIYQQLAASSPANRQRETQQRLKIAQLNIRYENSNIDKLLLTLSRADYDLLALQEVGDNWQQKIQKLSQTYPYSIGTSLADASPSGLVLFSRWPIVERKIHDLGYTGGHIIEALVQSPESGNPVQIFTLHPVSPRNEALWHLRNAALEYVAQLSAHSLLQYKIIIGDLNTSPWSAQFTYLQKNSLLSNSSNRFAYIPSWSYSNSNPLLSLLSSAYIDHCLISSSFQVISKNYQNIQASDHQLLSTELGML